MELFPLKSVLRVGDALELSCRVNGCPVNVLFTWSTTLDSFHGGAVEDNQTISLLVLSNVSTKHSNGIVCKAWCGVTRREKTSMIQVYCE